MWQAIQTQGEWQGEIWNRRKSGQAYPEWLRIRAVRDEQGMLMNYVGMFADISEFKVAQAHIERLAYYDHLTGLANRSMLLDHLRIALAQAHRKAQSVAVAFLDLDRFKAINDSLGHSVGDMLLLEAASRLTACVREGDTVARLGGDEFVLCLADTGNDMAQAAAAVEVVANKLRKQFVEPFQLDGREVVVTP